MRRLPCGRHGPTCSLTHSHDDVESDESPTGSSALNANSEADVWGSIPWNAENPSRSVNTSPSRTRDGGIPNPSAFYDHHAAIGTKKGAYGVSNFQDETEGYSSAYATQKRTAADAVYMDSIGPFSHSRDTSLPPSRGSPAFAPLYHHHGGHTPSNSIHSQRQISNHAISSFPTQASNQRAFNFNKQLEDDLTLRFARQIALDNSVNNGQPFDPASAPFQFNPGSQPWIGENARFANGLEFSADHLPGQFAAMKRPSIDRISPAPPYRLDNAGSPRNYASSPEAWINRPVSRDPRTVDQERRNSIQQYAANYHASFYPSQYPYAGLPPQYAPNFTDAYPQSFRHPMLPGYNLPPIHAAYPLASALPPVRPARDQDPGKGMRSVVLDDFRMSNKSSKRYELKDIYNYVVEFSGDQHGSRFIQQKLETANSDEKDQIFREIEPNATQLMKDVFGNYVVQKFFEHGNQVQKKVLADKMKGKVVDLSVQVYACRVVQKVWLFLSPDKRDY